MKTEKYTCLLAAGTTEGLEAMRILDSLHIKTAACVATELGGSMLSDTGAAVFAGRLDETGFEMFIKEHGVSFVIDATHPFAVEVSANLQRACKVCGICCVRYDRQSPDYDYDKIIHAASAEAAAKLLSEMEGNILLTTGANTAPVYRAAIDDFNTRVYIRVLDTKESRERCRAAGIAASHVIAKNPPFSKEDNEALIKEYQIKVLVSKDSGVRGGLIEKIESARAFGIHVVLIDRPKTAAEPSVRAAKTDGGKVSEAADKDGRKVSEAALEPSVCVVASAEALRQQIAALKEELCQKAE